MKHRELVGYDSPTRARCYTGRFAHRGKDCPKHYPGRHKRIHPLGAVVSGPGDRVTFEGNTMHPGDLPKLRAIPYDPPRVMPL